MIVIGADTHKRSHVLAALDRRTGALVAELEIAASEDGHLRALAWASELDTEVVWALEDCRHVAGGLERALIAAGHRVVRVPPRLTGASRRGERERGKSDRIDARAIARAVLREGIERFPTAALDENALEIRLLHDHRASLVAERSRQINRLRWHLVALCPELEAALPARSLRHEPHITKVARRLARLTPSARVRIAKTLTAAIRDLTRQINQLEHELERLVNAHSPDLVAETGVGALTAATLIGRTAGAERFPSDAHFARLAGTAPIPASSGRTVRHRLDRGGDRQLNCALHMITLTRMRLDPATRAYVQRRKTEGKTTREIIRCLKRYIARMVWKHLHQHAQTRPHRPHRTGHDLSPLMP
ncbi:MAG TPA: IS110 family transposase [Polyangia bacterium]